MIRVACGAGQGKSKASGAQAFCSNICLRNSEIKVMVSGHGKTNLRFRRQVRHVPRPARLVALHNLSSQELAAGRQEKIFYQGSAQGIEKARFRQENPSGSKPFPLTDLARFGSVLLDLAQFGRNLAETR